MKKVLIVAVAVTIVIAMTGGAWAGSTPASVSATASVAGVCQVNSGGTVAFGALDQVSGAQVNATVAQPVIWCTKGTPYTITSDNGANKNGTTYRLKGAANGDFITYTFSFTGSGTGSGKGTTFGAGITASILAGAYDNVSADTYGDTVTLTIGY